MIKKMILIIMLCFVLSFFYLSIEESKNYLNSYSKDYYISNALLETGSKNIVTAIYLDYKLFDSLFEAGILLIAVSGIVFMSKKDDEIL